jgi:hypothetical protein
MVCVSTFLRFVALLYVAHVVVFAHEARPITHIIDSNIIVFISMVFFIPELT